jgi:hypothetical protein
MAINKCGQGLALGERVPRRPSVEMPERLDLAVRGGWFSLSLRERAGVRGNRTHVVSEAYGVYKWRAP